MKKRYFVLFIAVLAFFTACGSSGNFNDKKNRTIDDLMDGYIRTYTKLDVEAGNSLFPEYYYNKAGEYTKEKLETIMEHTKESYGEDFSIKYDITKTTKMTDEELQKQNEEVKEIFDTEMEAEECYKYEGTITFKGSKFEDTDPIDTIAYCKYNGEWYLTTNYVD